jgi:O-acetyl-ADP-ribose deacetylase (regulator of RNase III)
VVHNDITEERGTITNPVNSELIHAGGVAEIISRKGGYVIEQ